MVYSELISSPVSVTCGSLLKGKAQARQETHHVQARRVLSVCACHSRVLHMCVYVCVCLGLFPPEEKGLPGYEGNLGS